MMLGRYIYVALNCKIINFALFNSGYTTILRFQVSKLKFKS